MVNVCDSRYLHDLLLGEILILVRSRHQHRALAYVELWVKFSAVGLEAICVSLFRQSVNKVICFMDVIRPWERCFLKQYTKNRVKCYLKQYMRNDADNFHSSEPNQVKTLRSPKHLLKAITFQVLQHPSDAGLSRPTPSADIFVSGKTPTEIPDESHSIYHFVFLRIDGRFPKHFSTHPDFPRRSRYSKVFDRPYRTGDTAKWQICIVRRLH